MTSIEYRVRSGDTLSGIARQHHVTVDVLARLNGLSDINHIWAGQVLRIPKETRSAQAVPPRPLSYRVRAGDTLAQVAEAHKVPIETLAQHNGVAPGDSVQIGLVLKVPAAEKTPTPKEKTSSNAKASDSKPTASLDPNGKLKAVHPKLAECVNGMATALEKRSILIRITDGIRTFEEQDALYAKGRTQQGKIVTHARGGYSNHNYGLAVDVVPMVNGKPDWGVAEEVWKAIGEAGQGAGLEWGGTWKKLVDKPHFQLPVGLAVDKCLTLYRQGGLSAVWAEADKRLGAPASQPAKDTKKDTKKNTKGTSTPPPPAPSTPVATQVPAEVIRHLELREGKLKDHQKVYDDGFGILTVGLGHKLTKSELARYKEHDIVPMPILEAWAQADAQNAYKAAVAQARKAGIGNQDFINALTAVNFQLGTLWYTEHKKTWAYIQAHEWEKAAVEATDSKWYKQTPVRVTDFQAALRAMKGRTVQPPAPSGPPAKTPPKTAPKPREPDLKDIVQKVREAMSGSGTDEVKVYTNLARLNHDAALITQFKSLYKATYRVDVVEEIKGDFSNSMLYGNELTQALSYLEPKKAQQPAPKTPGAAPVATGANQETLKKLGAQARKRLKLKNTGACARGVCEMLGAAGYHYEGARPFVATGIVGGKVYDYSVNQWISASTDCAWVSSHSKLDGNKVKEGAKVVTADASSCAKYASHTLKLFKFVDRTGVLKGDGRRQSAPQESVKALNALPEGAVVVFGPALSRSVQRTNGKYTVGGHGHAGHIGILVREGSEVLVVADGLLDSQGGKYTTETCLSNYAWAIGFVPTTEPLKLKKKDLPSSSL
jgi:LysM repeat protein/GH24 family phage-related lysozyme (muramidase)